MRRAGLVLLLLAGGVVCVLLVRAVREDAPRERRGVERAARPTEAEPARAVPGLVVRDGVAQAPSFAADADAAPRAGTHLFVGRAVSAGSRARVRGAAVVLETVDGARAWAQRATDDAGRFRAEAPADAGDDLRVVVRSDAGEVGVVAARRGGDDGDVTDLGVVVLRSQAKLEGRTLEPSDAPVAGVVVEAHVLYGLAVGPHPIARTHSDGDGNFELEPLPRGLFVVRGRDAAGRTFLAAPVEVPHGDPLVLRPIPAAPLAVVVHNSVGEPVPRALVEAIPRPVDPERDPLQVARFLAPYAATTDDDGHAEIAHLPAGRYLLYVTLENGAPFEFGHDHAGKTTRVLTVATETAFVFRFVRVPPPPAKPPPDPLPLVDRRIRIVATGGSSVPGRRRERSFSIRTDDDGRAVLPRLGSLGISFSAETIGNEDKLVGGAKIDTRQHPEAWFACEVRMRPPEELKDPAAPNARVRRARVRTSGGLPVKGARVYGGTGGRRETNADGVAEVGLATAKQCAYLHRPDLASGDPASPPFGQMDLVDLTWSEGREITVRVIHALDGYALDRDVRPEPRPGAWKRIAPGVFRTRWDPASAGPKARLSVEVEGYAPWTALPPTAPGEPVTFEAALMPATEAAATLLLDVRRSNAPATAAIVYGASRDGKPRAEFTTMADVDGRVRVSGLREGMWDLIARDRFGFRGTVQVRLMRGENRIPLDLTRRAAVAGTCVDDKGRPLAGVRIEPTGPKTKTPVGYSDAKGRFGVDAHRRSRLHATKAGYADVEMPVPSGRQRQRVRIVLPRLGAIDLPVRWPHGSGGPVPDDLCMLIAQRYTEPGRSGRRRTRVLRSVVRVEGGRLRAENLPPGRLILMQTRGSVRADPAMVTVAPGRTAHQPAIRLSAGGTLEGIVTRDRKPVPGALVYVRGRGSFRVLRAGENGEFRSTGLAPGVYHLDHPRQTKGSTQANARIRIDDGRLTKTTLELR